MIVREVLDQEKDKFEAVTSHPLQSWAWGEFRKATGVEIIRLGAFDGQSLLSSYQISTHLVPKLGWRIGYFPKGGQPDERQIFALKTAAQKYSLLFIKNEPNFYAPAETNDPQLEASRKFLEQNQSELGRPMFTPYSYVLGLNNSADQLFANLKQKTRYNVNLAQKSGVQVVQDDSDQGFEEYIKLWKQTTKRQEFYSHDEKYHRLMWKHMRQDNIAHLLKATYQGKTLGIWILFIYKNILYYPYGASSRENKEVMANNLLAWEAIKFGQAQNCYLFDMWGSLGPNPDKDDPWYGFHRFKAGYGGTLMEYIGTYDYIQDPQRYQLFKILDTWRWKLLRLRSKLPF